MGSERNARATDHRTHMAKDDIKEAGRIVNEINNLKIELNDLLEWSDIRGNLYYPLENYISAIDEAEYELLNNVKLPHCEWAES